MKKVFSLIAIVAMVGFISCQKTPNNPTPTPTPEPEPQPEPPTEVTITIDGDFSDWAAIDQAKLSTAKTNPDSSWDAVKEIKVHANADFVFYYIKFDKESVADLLSEGDELPIRLCINTDGEFASGYQNYFLQGYDFIVEGGLSDPANKTWGEYTGTFYQRLDGWKELLPSTGGMVTGKGAGNEYEIMLAREIFNSAAAGSDVPMLMGDIFQTGIRFYSTVSGSWEELSNMPNSAITEDNPNGYGNLLEIATIK